MSWLRVRFKCDADDPRPVKFPPPGPYWISGYGASDDAEYSILIAYVKEQQQIFEYWPEAVELEADAVDDISFTSRFPEPSWWQKLKSSFIAPDVRGKP